MTRVEDVDHREPRKPPTAAEVIQGPPGGQSTQVLHEAFLWRGPKSSDQDGLSRAFVRLAELCLALCPQACPEEIVEALGRAHEHVSSRIRPPVIPE